MTRHFMFYIYKYVFSLKEMTYHLIIVLGSLYIRNRVSLLDASNLYCYLSEISN